MGNTESQDQICTQEQDYLDAKAVADKLGIKLHRVDFIKEY
jgi:tRNA-specific 2-thiouridylase